MKYIKNTLVLFTCDKLGPYENFGIITKSAPQLLRNYKIGPCDLISKKPNGLFILLPKTIINPTHHTSPPYPLLPWPKLSPVQHPLIKTGSKPLTLGQPSSQTTLSLHYHPLTTATKPPWFHLQYHFHLTPQLSYPLPSTSHNLPNP